MNPAQCRRRVRVSRRRGAARRLTRVGRAYFFLPAFRLAPPLFFDAPFLAAPFFAAPFLPPFFAALRGALFFADFPALRADPAAFFAALRGAGFPFLAAAFRGAAAF